MGAVIKACKKSLTIKNTGIECSATMGPSSMLYAIPPGVSWTQEDLDGDFTQWLEEQIHADKTVRIIPLFGPEVPIRKITLNKESDVVPVQDDGTPIFIRYGMLTRMWGTTEGGLCYAEALQSLNKAGYTFIEIDNAYQILMRANEDGTFGGLKTTFMYSPSPDLPDFKNPGYIYFQITFSPQEYVGFGVIMQGDATMADLQGLIDTEVTDATGSSVTKLKIGVQTVCAETDLVALIGTPLAAIANFVVTEQDTGAVQTATAAAIVAGHIELTGTWTSGKTYTVALAAASVLYGNSIEGYEGTVSVDIAIP